ncbi:MAG: CvpA family protein [Candidatus Omnitrophica bacterium]|nr:CvpA family protein [Candidatus Omnitrophota bacterium]
MMDRIMAYFWWRGFGIVDIALGLMLVFGFYRGFQNGLTKEIGLLTEIYAALMVGMQFSLRWAEWLSTKVAMPAHLIQGFLFFGLCLFTLLPLKFALGLISKAVTLQFSPLLAKGGGMVLGMLRYVMLMSMISLTLVLFRSPYIHEAYVERSRTGRFSIAFPQIVHNETLRFFDRLALFSRIG